MEERELLGDTETEPPDTSTQGIPAYQGQHLGAEASTINPALGPGAEDHRESGGWAYPRKYQRAANATIDRVKLSQEGLEQGVPWPRNITVQVLALT